MFSLVVVAVSCNAFNMFKIKGKKKKKLLLQVSNVILWSAWRQIREAILG